MEEVIDFRVLLLMVLKKIKVVFLVALLIGIGLGTFKGVTLYRSSSVGANESGTISSSLDQAKRANVELKKVEMEIFQDNAKNAEAALMDYKVQTENSKILQSDSSGIYKCTITVMIDNEYKIDSVSGTKPVNNINDIIKGYTYYFDSQEYLETLEAQNVLKTTYFDLQYLKKVKQIGNAMIEFVYYDNDQRAAEKALDEIIMLIYDKVNKDIGSHKIKIISKYNTLAPRSFLETLKNNISLHFNNLEKAFNTAKVKYEENRAAYLEAEAEYKKGIKQNELDKAHKDRDLQQRKPTLISVTSLISVAKFTLLGILVGLILACIFVFILYSMDSTIKSRDELYKYGLPFMEDLSTLKNNKVV